MDPLGPTLSPWQAKSDNYFHMYVRLKIKQIKLISLQVKIMFTISGKKGAGPVDH